MEYSSEVFYCEDHNFHSCEFGKICHLVSDDLFPKIIIWPKFPNFFHRPQNFCADCRLHITALTQTQYIKISLQSAVRARILCPLVEIWKFRRNSDLRKTKVIADQIDKFRFIAGKTVIFTKKGSLLSYAINTVNNLC